MDKKERFNEAYRYLIGKGYAHKQRDVSEKMRTTPPNLSRALKGSENALTDNFLRRFNAAYNNIFNNNWLIFGEGEMLSPAPVSAPTITQTSVGDHNTTTATATNVDKVLLDEIQAHRKQVDRLITIIEEMQKKQ